MHIGAVAKRTGLTVGAIRFYEESGLLPHPARTPGGFRKYRTSDVGALSFIRRAQGLGFTLGEIRDMLALAGARSQPCGAVRRRLLEKLAGVRRKEADLRRLEEELRLALGACDRELRKRNPQCPILLTGNWRKARG